jgi:hypothetical protein
MEIFKLLTALAGFLRGVLQLDDRAWKRLSQLASRFTGRTGPRSSYDNLSLAIELDLRDAAGTRAVLRRVQRVRFLTEEAGVIRDVIWGEGRTLAGYRVEGAKRLSVRHEGSRKIVLLGLPTNPGKGESVTVRSERTIAGGFTKDECYLETFVERPTKDLRLTVLFPKSRVPTAVAFESSPPVLAGRALPLSLTAGGRSSSTWTCESPRMLVTYRIRWTW